MPLLTFYDAPYRDYRQLLCLARDSGCIEREAARVPVSRVDPREINARKILNADCISTAPNVTGRNTVENRNRRFTSFFRVLTRCDLCSAGVCTLHGGNERAVSSGEGNEGESLLASAVS